MANIKEILEKSKSNRKIKWSKFLRNRWVRRYFKAMELIVLAMAFFYFTPTTCTIGLEQINPAGLPFKGAELTFQYSDRSENVQLHTLPAEVVFKEIHSRHKSSPARIIIQSQGYNTIDTIVKLEKKVGLVLHRDATFSVIFGITVSFM